MEVDGLPQHLSISIAQHEGQKATEPRGDMQQARAVASPFTAEGYMANISDFTSLVVFIATTQIYHCSTNRAVDHT